MLDVEVAPASGAGPWQLGAPIGDALALVAQRPRLIPRAVVAHQEGVSPADLALHLPDNGLLFRFDPYTQRLRCIEVTDVSRVRLTYHGQVFSAPDVPATFQLVYARFGPSVPGDYQPSSRLYLLSYPGLTLAFPIPERYHHLYTSATDLPLELPDGSSPLLERLIIFQGASMKSITLAPLPPSSLYGEPVRGVLHEGLVFERRNAGLEFGAANQEAQALLGPPSRVYFKHEERLRIHARAPSGSSASGAAGSGAAAGGKGGESDYFLNYFALGIDLLMDGSLHRLKKCILHSNCPSHPDFNQYSKCFWRLQLANSDAVLDSKSTWDEVQAMMGSAGKPLVYSKGGNASPFGSSLFYAYEGVIFEVLRSGAIASVTLFRSTSPKNP